MRIIIFLFNSFFWFALAFSQPNPVMVGQGSTAWAQERKSVRDSHGWLYVVYNDSLYRVICARSTDNGQTWPKSYFLNRIGPNTGGVAPAIAIAKGDTLYVVWTQSYFDSSGRWGQDVFWSQFNDTSWSPMLNVNHQLNTYYTSLVVDPSNQPHVVWDADASPFTVFYSKRVGAVWTPPEIASDGGSMYPSLGVDSLGNLHLAYYVGNISYREHTGSGWSPPAVISLGQGRPCLVVDFKGHLHVVWYSVSPLEIYYSFYNDTTWSPPLNLSNNVGQSLYPTISCDSRNNLYVAWNDNSMDTTKFPRIFYRIYDGISWSPISVISTDTTWPCDVPNFGYPMTDSGVDVVWTQWYNNQWSVMYRRLPLVGSGVEGEKQTGLNVGDIKLTVQSPVRRELCVSYFLPSQSKVSLVLYDLSGRKVMVLDEGERPGGRYDFKCPLALPAGVYFLRLEAGRAGLTRKVVLIR